MLALKSQVDQLPLPKVTMKSGSVLPHLARITAKSTAVRTARTPSIINPSPSPDKRGSYEVTVILMPKKVF